jgi:hypothetical protein
VRVAKPRGNSQTRRRCKHFEGAETASMKSDHFDRLLGAARERGQVPVIVRLCLPFRPEGELTAEGVRRQRSAIARSQDALLKGLSGSRVANVRRFEYTPFVALTVGAEALLRLRSSPEVADISEDAVDSPTNE